MMLFLLKKAKDIRDLRTGRRRSTLPAQLARSTNSFARCRRRRSEARIQSFRLPTRPSEIGWQQASQSAIIRCAFWRVETSIRTRPSAARAWGRRRYSPNCSRLAPFFAGRQPSGLQSLSSLSRRNAYTCVDSFAGRDRKTSQLFRSAVGISRLARRRLFRLRHGAGGDFAQAFPLLERKQFHDSAVNFDSHFVAERPAAFNGLSPRPRTHCRSANTNSAVPALTAMYCFPLTA